MSLSKRTCQHALGHMSDRRGISWWEKKYINFVSTCSACPPFASGGRAVVPGLGEKGSGPGECFRCSRAGTRIRTFHTQSYSFSEAPSINHGQKALCTNLIEHIEGLRLNVKAASLTSTEDVEEAMPLRRESSSLPSPTHAMERLSGAEIRSMARLVLTLCINSTRD